MPSAASYTGNAIKLMPRLAVNESPNLTFVASGPTTGVTFTIKVEESADNNTFSIKDTHTLVKSGAEAVLMNLRLQPSFKGPFARVSYTASGASVTGLTVFAGFTQDQAAPYERDLLIDKGGLV
jgi:hypothetical protein